MALTAWISRFIPNQPSYAPVKKSKINASPVTIKDPAPIDDALAAMRPGSSPWCTTHAAFSDQDNNRRWLIEESTALAEHLSADPGIAQLAGQLTDTLLIPDLALAPAPTTSMQLFALLRDEKVGIHTIQDVLKEDPALLKQVWLKASSAHFATPPRDLKYAIARVGLHELGRLAAAEVVSARAFGTSVYRSLSASIRERCIVTGELIRRHSSGSPADAYLCGLLHGVGSLIVLGAATQETVALTRTLPRILSKLDAPLGMLALSRWRLPESVCFAVGYQASPGQAPPAHRSLAVLCRASSLAVHGAQGMRRRVNNGALEAIESLEGPSLDAEELLRDASALLKQHRDHD